MKQGAKTRVSPFPSPCPNILRRSVDKEMKEHLVVITTGAGANFENEFSRRNKKKKRDTTTGRRFVSF